jgi:hypothetical protein
MTNYAYVLGDLIVNIVAADSLESAESVLGVGNVFEIQENEHNDFVIGDALDDKKKAQVEKNRVARIEESNQVAIGDIFEPEAPADPVK